MSKLNQHNLSSPGLLGALFLGGALLALGGCATATGPAPSQASNGGTQIGNASFKSKMASSIFLQPVAPSKRVIFLEGHNTSSAQGLNFNQYLTGKLLGAGYRLTNKPSKATYMLMYNIRYLGKETKDETAAGALAGGFAGALVESSLQSGDNYWWWGGGEGVQQTARAGIIGAVIGGVAGHFLSKNFFMMVVDIQVEQRNANARTATQTNASEGLGNTTRSTSGFSGWQIYRDRLVSQAGGRQLTFGYIKPALQKVMSGEIAGIFAP